jgi:hypothetical protein
MKNDAGCDEVVVKVHGLPSAGRQSPPALLSYGVSRPGLERLRHAVHVFTAAERRLRGRYQRRGEALSHGHLRALFVLIAEEEVPAGRLARDAELNPAGVTAMVDQLGPRAWCSDGVTSKTAECAGYPSLNKGVPR